MTNPILWYLFAGLFIMAGVMNFARSARRTDSKKQVNLILGFASLIWAAAAILFRFVGTVPGYTAGGIAMACMLAAAFIGAKNQT
jgi:hypothetical protein